MLVRRLAVVGLVLGLFVMHGLAPGSPAVAAGHVHHATAGASGSSHGAPMPDGHGVPGSHELCVAVLGAPAVPGLVAAGALSGVVSPSPLVSRSAHRVPWRGPAAVPDRPPDLARLCVLLI